MQQNWRSFFVIVPFFGFLLLFLCLGMLMPDYSTSVEEQRTLAQRPVFDFNEIPSLPEKLSDYVVDQFPGRSHFLRFHSALELAQGKFLARNTYVTKDGWLMSKIYPISDNQYNQLSSALQTMQKSCDINLVWATIPQKNDMLLPHIEQFVDNSPSDENKAKLLTTLSHLQIPCVNVGSEFLNSYDLSTREGMYFKTDLHWNHMAAYRAAEYICSCLGNPVPDDAFIWTELGSQHTYLGDLNRRFSYLHSTNELIPFYEYRNASSLHYYDTPQGINTVERESIVGRDIDQQALNYNNLSTYNLGYYRVENPSAPVNECILILKDSFQNATIDYFSAVYREVNVVDPRYYQEELSLYELIRVRQINTILFFYHQNNVSTELIEFITP